MAPTPRFWTFALPCLAFVVGLGATASAEEAAEAPAEGLSPGGEGAVPEAPVPPTSSVVEDEEVDAEESGATERRLDSFEETDGDAARPVEPQVESPEPVPEVGSERAAASTPTTFRCALAGLEETDPVFAVTHGALWVGLVGSLQLLGVPFIQDPYASVEAGSIANAEGFRLRRARLGFAGALATWLDFDLKVELTEHGADVLDASLTFAPHPLARITAGALKVPFSRVMMLTAEYQTFLDRPYPVRSIAPDRSLGLQVSGSMRWFTYWAGVFNGGGDYYRGDNNDGMLYAARFAVHPLGPLPPGEVTLPESVVFQAAGSYLFNQDATGDRHAATGELILRWAGLTVQGEVLWSLFDPSGDPLTDEGVEYGHTERLGWFAEASYFILPGHLQVAARYEGQLVREALEFHDLNDLWAVSGAVNGYLLHGRLKLSLEYQHRHEWFDRQVPNDYVALQLQGRI